MIGGWVEEKDDVIWKLLLGDGPDDKAECDVTTGFGVDSQSQSLIFSGHHNKANGTKDICESLVKVCGNTVETGCMFNLSEDPGEKNNMAKAKPGMFKYLMGQINSHKANLFNPRRGRFDEASCQSSDNYFNTYLGPWEKTWKTILEEYPDGQFHS